jgi:hypothetical protein
MHMAKGHQLTEMEMKKGSQTVVAQLQLQI